MCLLRQKLVLGEKKKKHSSVNVRSHGLRHTTQHVAQENIEEKRTQHVAQENIEGKRRFWAKEPSVVQKKTISTQNVLRRTPICFSAICAIFRSLAICVSAAEFVRVFFAASTYIYICFFFQVRSFLGEVRRHSREGPMLEARGVTKGLNELLQTQATLCRLLY